MGSAGVEVRKNIKNVTAKALSSLCLTKVLVSFRNWNRYLCPWNNHPLLYEGCIFNKMYYRVECGRMAFDADSASYN